MTPGTDNHELFENLRLELRRGSLILAVLAALRKEHYGYTLRKTLGDLGVAIDEGTLYPLLRRLETKGLPEAQREDIIRELSEDIRSEMEDKEAELRRPLTEAEQQAILKRRGNPAFLAARFRQDHRSVAFGPQLIGPVLFPFYIKVLSFNLGLTFIIIGTIFFTLSVSGQNITFHAIFSSVFLQLLIQLSAVTLIFSLIQRHLNKYPDSWNLGGMGDGVHVDLKFASDMKLAKRTDRQVSRFESVSIIVASAVALVWLAEVRRHPFLIFGPAAYFLQLAPISGSTLFPYTTLFRLGTVRP